MNGDLATGPRWSLTLGTALGIPIRVHFTFFLLLVWYGIYSASAGHNPALAVAFLMLLFGCVVLHELGHATMARRFGVRTREIVLYPIGGIARLENIPAGLAELSIALAGPAVNLLLAGLLGAWLFASGIAFAFPPKLLAPSHLLAHLFWVNLILMLFNLLPAFPMDGGRVLRAAMTLAISQDRATEIAVVIGQGVAILFGIAGILGHNVFLMVIALFVFVGAAQEGVFQRQRSVFEGKRAHQAMITRFETLAPDDSLQRATEHLLATHQQDFPVVDAWNRVVGVLPRAHLMRGLARQGGSAAVLEAMERNPPLVHPEAPLERVLELLRERSACPVIVVDGGQLRGMITLENLTEYLEIARRTVAGQAR